MHTPLEYICTSLVHMSTYDVHVHFRCAHSTTCTGAYFKQSLNAFLIRYITVHESKLITKLVAKLIQIELKYLVCTSARAEMGSIAIQVLRDTFESTSASN